MLRCFSFVLGVVLFGLPAIGLGQNPNWPPTNVTPADLMDPQHWPDDDSYGYDRSGEGTTCTPSGFCWSNNTGGGWGLWSWVPPETLTLDGEVLLRPVEEQSGAGTWTDMAWQHTIGDRRVVIAVLDSGIHWDEVDLVNQHFINRAELETATADTRCLPQAPDGHKGDAVDLDGDGVLSMRDWFVGRDETERTALTAALDSVGNGNGIADPGDLIVLCSDGVDDDNNGYADDISGWDFHANDNDPADDRRFGHGTTEARWSMAEANNGTGRAGHCPGCRALSVRVGDSFVSDSQDYAQGVVFSVDSGAVIVQEALGTLNNTTFMRRANDYAYANDVLVVASAADENSRHHNYPATSNHTLHVHAITYAGGNPQRSRSFLAFNNCTNYGAQLQLSAPGTACSSEGTAVTAGIAGLIYSQAISEDRPGGPLSPPLSAEELRQLILMNAFDIDIPESIPGSPGFDRSWYPSVEGWDQRFGYGRVDAYRSVVAVREGRIPPQADVVYPDWFRVVYPDREPNVEIRGAISAPRAPSFDYVVEWAPGVMPAAGDFTTIVEETEQTEPLQGVLATFDVSDLEIDNGGEGDPHLAPDRYLVTVRVRVIANYGGEVGAVRGETRRAFHIYRDPTLVPGFPVALGVRNEMDPYPAASGEASPKLADIDNDDALEIIYADSDGLLHVLNGDATPVGGYPIQLGTLRGYDPEDPANVLGSRGYASGEVPTEDLGPSVVLSTPAIGDLDDDGTLEIVAPTMEGDIWVFSAPDGTVRNGWPVGLPEVLSGDTLRGGPVGPNSAIERGIVPAPSLADLDGDGMLEVVVAASDGRIYVYRHDGTPQEGFPVDVVAPQLWADPTEAKPGRIMTAPAVGDVNDDGIPDIAVGSNETGSDGNTGAVHVIHGDGTAHAGGPAHENWPIRVDSVNFFPIVGEGVPTPVAMADADGDGVADLALAGTAGRVQVLPGIQPARMPGQDPQALVILDSAGRGALHDIADRSDRPLLNTFGAGTFGDLNQDGSLDFVTGGAGLRLALNLGGGFQNVPFSHQVGVWDVTSGEILDGFPRHIEDYLFFVNPTMGDVDGDSYPEVVTGSGGYYVHAWDACGEEADGFPKFTGGWIASAVALGDIDGDDLLEAVVATRAGYLFAWDLPAPSDTTLPWPEYRHDNHNTGNYDHPLSNEGTVFGAERPLVCDVPVVDAGVTSDGGVDTDPGGGGCGCTVGGRPGAALPWMLFVLGAVWRWRRAF